MEFPKGRPPETRITPILAMILWRMQFMNAEQLEKANYLIDVTQREVLRIAREDDRPEEELGTINKLYRDTQRAIDDLGMISRLHRTRRTAVQTNLTA